MSFDDGESHETNINSLGTNANSYLPNIHSKNCPTTNSNTSANSLRTSKSQQNVRKKQYVYGQKILLSQIEPIKEVYADNNNDFYMTATKEEKKNDNKDEKYKIVYNEIVKAPIWKKAAEMNINKSVSIKKNKKINIGAKMTIREYINKTRDIILLKNSCEIKSNRINKINETYKSQIYSINQTISSLLSAKKKINNECFDKYNSYIKHLARREDEERENCYLLKNNIASLKKELADLEVIIKSQSDKKTSLSRWVYFQIQLKEHLKELPPYYYSVMDSYNSDNTYSNVVNLFKPRISHESGLISTEEKKRLIEYRKRTVYDNVEEFDEAFKKMEDTNLRLISEQNKSEKELEKIKEERDTLKKEIEDEAQREINEIQNAEKKLQYVKRIYMRLVYEKIKTENTNKAKIKINSSHRILYGNKQKLFHSLSCESLKVLQLENNNHNVFTNNVYLKKKGLLYNKIFNVFTTALLLKDGALDNDDTEDKSARVQLTNESEMLEMLQYIEKVLMILLDYNKSIKNNEELLPLLKGIYVKIDKDNKSKKNMYQKELLRQQEEIKKKKIEERTKKVYFIPLRKVDMKYSQQLKLNKINKTRKTIDSNDLQFVDFIFDESDNNN